MQTLVQEAREAAALLSVTRDILAIPADVLLLTEEARGAAGPVFCV
jgi:hypothetical protein